VFKSKRKNEGILKNGLSESNASPLDGPILMKFQKEGNSPSGIIAK
jgi:hypothetical protein